MTDSARNRDDRRQEFDRLRRRRGSVTFRLAAPLRLTEHWLRRIVADRRLPSKPVSALNVILPLVQTFGDPSVLYKTDRIAVVASYGASETVSRSLVTLVEEFEKNGYKVVLVRASDSSLPPVWPAGERVPSVVVVKPNAGYDFGSWATALALFPVIADAQHILFANDSLLGPFSSLTPMIEDFEQSSSDVWGATDTVEHRPHLQSFLIGFTGQVLRHPAIRSFWRHVRVIEDKDVIVARYEMGLSRLLTSESFSTRPWFAHEQIVPEGGNPTTVGGSRLIAGGFPFVKRILIENPEIFPDAALATSLVADKFGENVRDWI